VVSNPEDRIPGLKAASGVSGGATPLLSKVAPSGRVPAKARRAVATNLSPVATLRPGGQVATPAAAHATVGRQVVTRHSDEGDAHGTSGVHNKMSEANVSHEHHTGQELSSEDESPCPYPHLLQAKNPSRLPFGWKLLRR
jgi:hypothetical protein